MNRFSEWNVRLLQSFFSEASSGEEVFLRVERDFLDQIGQDIGGDSGFIAAVRSGPEWLNADKLSLSDVISHLIRQRKRQPDLYIDPGRLDSTYSGLFAPAYLPYLAALVRNVSANPEAFYAGLKSDLRLEREFGSIHLSKIESAWEDLENWTRNNEGRFGFFKLRRLGGYSRIGIPRSQVVLKPSDVEALARIFLQAEAFPGYELNERHLNRVMEQARAESHIFSAGFRDALTLPVFEQPIRSAIVNAHSDWDGTLPPRFATHDISADASTPTYSELREIGLTLTLLSSEPARFQAHWRVPALFDHGHYTLIHDNFRWGGSFSGTEGSNTNVTDFNDGIWDLVELAAKEHLVFEFEYHTSDDSEPDRTKLLLKPHPIWILVPKLNLFTGDYELREGVLPGSGRAFLLAAPSSASSLAQYLERESLEYIDLSNSGLPKDWLFIQITDCAQLTEEQRLLPDGAERAHPRPRAIKFVGGRSIRRGYSRMYLPYDLPMLELDAPSDVQLVHDSTLALLPLPSGERALSGGITLCPLRRFAIQLQHSRSSTYTLEAIDDEGRSHGTAKLRILGIGGAGVDATSDFSIDCLGRSQSNKSGLLGALLNDIDTGSYKSLGGFPDFSSSQEPNIRLSESLVVEDRLDAEFNVEEKFLDALALAGSRDFGSARDLIARLLVSHARSDEPVLILLSLQRQGHLEIATTAKGHISRVHAVPPAFYSLPFSANGKIIWGLAGTLRLEHWKKIAQERLLWRAWRTNQDTLGLQSWRLTVDNESNARKGADELGISYTHAPFVSIIQWAGDLKLFRDQTCINMSESLGGARENAMRFNANRGLFTARPTEQTCELWKLLDLDTRMDRLYVLVKDGMYSFVTDSRWGIWLALDEFARWVKNAFNRDDVHPFPVTYCVQRKTIWLPARLSPPKVLERALILCNGTLPNVIQLERKLAIETDQERIFLYRRNEDEPVLSVSTAYSGMAEGRWLAYSNIPESIAVVFSEKLGVSLDCI